MYRKVGKRPQGLVVFQWRALALSALLIGFSINSLSAATIYANSSSGNDANDGLSAGNAKKTFHGAYGAASAGDTIDLTGTFTWTDSDETGDVVNFGYNIAKNLVIQGQGANSTFVQAHGSPNSADRRVFEITANNVEFKGLTIRHGGASFRAAGSTPHRAYGGAIGYPYNTTFTSSYSLTIRECVLTANYSRLSDGAVNPALYAGGIVLMENSSIHSNTTNRSNEDFVRLAFNSSTAQLSRVFRNCTFSNNTTSNSTKSDVYDFFLDRSSASFEHCTFSNSNRAIRVDGSAPRVYLNNCIVYGSTDNMDILITRGVSSSINIRNSIVGYTSGTMNFISGPTASSSQTVNISSSLAQNSSNIGTPTLALSSGSVAIDAADPNYSNSPNNTDQRGFFPNGTRDIGAYEFNGFATPCDANVAVAPSGAGTQGDPYLIANFGNLHWISENSSSWGAYFRQTANIDAAVSSEACYKGGAGWSPIGNSVTSFTGEYDGQGNTISNLSINRPSSISVGMFGRTANGASLKSINLVAVDITGSHEVGALVGTPLNSGTTTIDAVTVTGSISSARTGANAADLGGLVGYAQATSISNSSVNATISGEGRNIGGIAGDGAANTSISNSYVNGSISGTGTQGQIGGIAGLYRGSGIDNCYSTASVTAGSVSSNPGVGGLIGQLSSGITVSNSYASGAVTHTSGATLGGLIGINANANDANLTNCFWDTQTSGQSNSDGGTGKTTAEMKVESTFTAWDFNSTWSILTLDNLSYPYLQSATQNPAPGIVPVEYASGNGSSGAPFQISDLNQLYKLSNDNSNWDKYFVQTANIDASSSASWNGGQGFNPIGNTTTKFTGTYDGGGFTISDLAVNRPSADYQGLFGVADGANLTQIQVLNASVVGRSRSAVVCGMAENGTNINKVFASGSITGQRSDNFTQVAGIIGYQLLSHLSQSASAVNVTGNHGSLGSLVGYATSNTLNGSTISDCYSSGSVTSNNNNEFVGSLIGGVNNVSINRCYARGLVTNSNTTNVGGFVGGDNGGANTVSNSFYNSSTTGKSTSAVGGTALNTAQMQEVSSYVDNWDFSLASNIWGYNPNENSAYPFLRWQGTSLAQIWLRQTDADWSTGTNWSENSVPTSSSIVVVPNQAKIDKLVISSAADAGSVFLESGAQLEVTHGHSLAISNDLNNNGSLSLLATGGGSPAYAQMKINGNYSGSGTVHQEQNFKGGWQMVATSMNATSASHFGNVGSNAINGASNTQNLFYWDGSDYVNVPDNSASITPGQGYFGYVGTYGFRENAGVQRFSGSPNTAASPSLNNNQAAGSITIEGGQGDQGWNLIANPFTCALDFSSIARTHVDNAFYVYDNNKSGGAGYIAYSEAGIVNPEIAPLQSFWVKANAASPSMGSMNMAGHGTLAQSPQHYKTNGKNFDRLVLRSRALADSATDDYTVVAFIAGTTDGFDSEWDAHKLANGGDNPNLYSLSQATAMATNAIDFGPANTEAKTVDLGFQAPQQAAVYEISFDDSYMLHQYSVFLEDKKTQAFHDLRQGAYRFAQDSNWVQRFVLHLQSQSVGKPAFAPQTTSLEAWVHQGQLQILSNYAFEGQVELRSLGGQIVYRSAISAEADAPLRRSLPTELASGVYLLSLREQGRSHNFKVYLD